MFIPNYKIASITLAIALISTTSLPTSHASKVTPPLTKCFIRVDNPHLSDSIKKQKGFEAVKVNATSKCDKQIRNLRLTVVIYKKGFFRNHEVVVGTLKIPELIPAFQKIENKGTWERCKNRKPSRYFGVAYAEAIINGKYMQTLRVRTDKVIALPCGT
jgi:hypothetical protein